MKLQLVATVLFIGCIVPPSMAAPLREEEEAKAVLQVIQMLLESENHGHGEILHSKQRSSTTSGHGPSSQSSKGTGKSSYVCIELKHILNVKVKCTVA